MQPILNLPLIPKGEQSYHFLHHGAGLRAVNLYFVISYLPSLPHPAYFSLVALLAAAYLGLTTYLVLMGRRVPGGWGRQGEETTDGGRSGDAPGASS